MKKTLAVLGVVAALLSAGAFAQTKGEADAEQSKAVPSQKASAAEKAAARKARNEQGKKTVKAEKPGDDQPSTAAATGVPKAERKAAKATRKAAGTKANKEPKDMSGPSS